MAAGRAMLGEIERRPPYAELEKKGALLDGLITAEVLRLGLRDSVCYTRAGSLSTLFFAASPVSDFASARRSDTARYASFFHAMRERGFFLPPAQFEAWFLSTAHTESDLRHAAHAVGESLSIAFDRGRSGI
jgi:glutamate-1-semialdehyde 2,1-aminomutase